MIIRVAAALLILALVSTGAFSQEQKVIFCAESISYNKGSVGGSINQQLCSSKCAEHAADDCLSKETANGWQVVASTSKETPKDIGGGDHCACIGIQYVLKKESKGSSGSSKAGKESSLRDKELELLKKENALLKKEIEQLKNKK